MTDKKNNETSPTEHVSLPVIPLDQRPQFIDKAIKMLRMHKNLDYVQSKLKPAEKRFSKAIHQPLVQLVSELGAKTVARPSGLLGGGLVAFIGSAGYLWLTRSYHLPYNYGFFFLFFLGGFLLGLAGEYGLALLHKLRR